MPTLLEALLNNESGGRNIPNTTQGTSSGQAQGYFQITTGTWDEFGGRQYAPNPLQATYEQQAAIASKIPLRRWDESTVASMRATGKPIDPNRTLGENLTANGESFAGAARVSGPVEAAGGGVGSDKGAPQLYAQPVINTTTIVADQTPLPTPTPFLGRPGNDPWSSLASGLASSLQPGVGAQTGGSSGADDTMAPLPEFETAQPALPPAAAPVDMSVMAADGGEGTGLADLFKLPAIDSIGQALALNTDQMGNPIVRRQYG